MHLKEEYQLCSIAGKGFLIPIGTAVVDVQSMLELNEVSAFILKLLQEGEYSKEELEEKIFAEYEADRDTIGKDLQIFLEKGKKIGFIEE